MGFLFLLPFQSTLSFHHSLPFPQTYTIYLSLFHFLTSHSRPSLFLSVTFY